VTTGQTCPMAKDDQPKKNSRPGCAPEKLPLQEIDISLLATLAAYQSEDGHVSIRPLTRDELYEWMETRESPEIHQWTHEVMDAVIGRRIVRR